MSLAPLVSKTCTPCRGGDPPLTFSEVATHHQQTPEWSVLDEAHRIERTYRFKNFAKAYAFVQKVAELAESEGHHPDVSFGWVRHGLSTNEEDQRLARERLHHGREARTGQLTVDIWQTSN